MKLLRGLQADRLITQIAGMDDPSSPDARKAIDKLSQLGPAAVPKLIEALAGADRTQTVVFVEVLERLLDLKTLPYFREALANPNARILNSVAWVLSSRKNYDPNSLLDLLQNDEVSKARLLEVLNSHKDRLDVRALLRHAYELDSKEKNALFRLVGDLADESLVPELIDRLTGKDSGVRAHIIAILGRFHRPDVATALQKELRDGNKTVRHAALSSLASMPALIDISRLCGMLCDAEIDVQDKAVDVIVKLNHPETTKHLLNALKDENEYARRAAVEVLNHIGTPDNVKDLLTLLKDNDWWVRSRATDALASIGGDRVMDAVFALFKDREDEDIRRAAVEIINTTKDPRAFEILIKATSDPDWWVRERAADALAQMGDKRAVPALVAMLQSTPQSVPVVIRALSTLGERKALPHILPLVERTEKDIKIEAMQALVRLADENSAETVRTRLQAMTATSDADIDQMAHQSLDELNDRYSPTQIAANERAAKFVEPTRTLLMEDISPAEAEAAEPEAKLDITLLKPGDVIENRYEFIQQIGRGAFGTVLLVEDKVVGERLVLKFLNKNIAEDDEMMKRFVDEVKNARKITHKNVIRLYDFLWLDGLYAISMEYFPSHPLGAEVARNQAVEEKRALGMALDVATGMTVAHQEDIVHRDLKPANILINNDDLVKIVDFGVSAALNRDTHLTKTGYVIGSPKYMAPEQILGKPMDQRVDIYSLGVILYELLTGRAPYSDGDQMSVMYQHVQGKAPPVDKVNPAVSPEVGKLVSKAMAVDKVKRFQTMDEFKRCITELLH